MKKIIVVYWMGSKLNGLTYEHGEEFDYSEETQNGIINTVLQSGNNVMVQQVKDTESLVIWIDSKNFRQR